MQIKDLNSFHIANQATESNKKLQAQKFLEYVKANYLLDRKPQNQANFDPYQDNVGRGVKDGKQLTEWDIEIRNEISKMINEYISQIN